MNTTPQFKEVWQRLRRSASAVLLLGLLTAQQAIANAPPAGTSITNKASVTYLDNTLNRQTVDSNDVVTIVQQVGAFTFSNTGNTRQGGAGSTVYVQHSITNTGNGADTFRIEVEDTANPVGTFSNIQVYRDNGVGLPTGNALCVLTPSGNNPPPACSSGATTVIDSGNTFNFVVAYSIPGNAATSWTGGTNQASVKVGPVNNNATLFATYNPQSITATDTIESASGAIFTLNQAFVAPANGINPSTITGSINPWPVFSSGLRGTQTTVTLTYQNTGDSSGNAYIKNAIPSGFDYVEGSAVLSCASGVGLLSDGSNSQAVCNNAGIEFEVTNGVMSAVVPNVPVNSQATLSYQVRVKATAAFGFADTTSQVEFATCSTAALATCSNITSLTRSNELRFNVLAAQSVVFNVADATPRDTNDKKTTVNIVPGRPAFQTHTITNSGDAQDTFNLSIAAGNYPAGTEFVWFNEDTGNPGRATTALSDTNGDGIVDTGAIAASASKNLILRITIPQGTTSAPSVNYEATATATSVRVFNNQPVSDTTLVSVTNVIAGLVDLSVIDPTNNQPVDKVEFGPLPAGGDLIEVPITITNNDSQDNNFKIESSTNPNQFPGNLPDGWTVTYSSTQCSISPLTPVDPNSVPVTSGTTQTLYACISTPTDAPADETSVYFKVTANQDASDGSRPSDTIEVSIDLIAADSYSMSLSAGSNQTVTPGGSVDFNFTLANTGSFACGAGDNRLRVQAQLPADRVSQGWTVSVFRRGFNKDGSSSAPNNTNVDLANDDTLLDAVGGLLVNSSRDFVVRVFAPATASQGLSVTVNITVSDVDAQNLLQTSPNGCGQQQSSITLNTISSLLGVTKTHYVDATCSTFNAGSLVGTTLNAKPGDCIYYRVRVVNNGSSNVTNVAITDRAPTGTTLRTGAGQAPRCTGTGLNVLNSGNLQGGISGQEVTCSSGPNGNTLAPSGTITFDFEVQVNQ